MAQTLRLAQDLSIPLESVTDTFAILGIRGSGKTNTAVVMTEQRIKHGTVTVVIDPLDVWWGLKSSADGKSAGLPVIVFGGRHQDAPLESGAGAIIARWVMKERHPAILSLKHLSHAQQTKFVEEFAIELYRRNDDPIHVVIDEVARLCPQKVRPEMARCVGAIQDLGSEGRASGIGTTVIGQRAARVNKDVLTQAHTLIAMQTVAALDRKQIEEWVGENGDETVLRAMMREMVALPQGVGFYYAPREGAPRKVKFDARTTFDSSATPKVGVKRPEARVFTKIDTTRLAGEIAATIEEAKADDPKALRATIADLQKKLATAGGADPAEVKQLRARISELEARPPERVEVPTLTDADRTALANTRTALRSLDTVRAELIELFDRAERRFGAAPLPVPARPEPVARREAPRPTATPPARREAAPRAQNPIDGERVTPACRRILDALGTRDPHPLARKSIALLADQSPSSSSFANNCAWLNARGFLVRNGDATLNLSDKGRAAVGPGVEVPRTSAEMLKMWRGKFPPAKWRIIEALAAAYPKTLDRDTLADRVEASATSSSFANNLASLSALGLVDRVSAGVLRASDALLPTGPIR